MIDEGQSDCWQSIRIVGICFNYNNGNKYNNINVYILHTQWLRCFLCVGVHWGEEIIYTQAEHGLWLASIKKNNNDNDNDKTLWPLSSNTGRQGDSQRETEHAVETAVFTLPLDLERQVTTNLA